MKIHHGRTTVKTAGRIGIENVTERVSAELARSGLRDGIAVVSVPHTTCGLVVNEDEAGLRKDIVRLVATLLSPLAAEQPFSHDCVDDNAQAHLTSLILGHSVTVPVAAARLDLGTWQSIFLVEMDGPRSRSLDVRLFGE
ncbi:MAG TPA: secondary thiamine-phosphate synthase enzyme YjbQ [Candidatus Polarisedimenticolia bacterium]|nr:secondary thiamine-phosphate synthase enzyme YjbQ [Candidatus Polarisedimenticolia bacterium]